MKRRYKKRDTIYTSLRTSTPTARNIPILEKIPYGKTPKGRLSEGLLNKAVIKLYARSREGLTIDKLAIDLGKILTRLSREATGSAKQRQEREAMIDELLKSAKASKKEREKILEDAKLITKMMATDDEVESQKLSEEIEKRGLFD